MGVIAEYYVETKVSLEEAAARIANEQSAGLTDNDMERFSDLTQMRGLAEVLTISECGVRAGRLGTPTSAPANTKRNALRAATVRIRFPSLDPMVGLDSILNVVFGEPQNLGVLDALELTDLDFENHAFSGPRSGLLGIRERLRVPQRAIVCAPIKPSSGLDLRDHVKRGQEAATGGADIVKDDELCLDTAYNPLGPRVRTLLAALRTVEDETGEGRLYVANLIGRRATLRERLETAASNGAEAVMVAPSLMGFDVVEEVRHRCDLMIFAHSSFTLSYTRVPGFGLSLSLWVKLQRLYGADGILLPSHGGSFGVSESETVESVRQCLKTNLGVAPSAPAHSGSMNALILPLLRRLSGGDNFILTSGSGLFDHPSGPAAGARDLRLAVERSLDQNSTRWLKSWETFK